MKGQLDQERDLKIIQLQPRPTTMAPDIYINTAIPQNVDSWYTFKTNNSGVYDVVIFAANYGSIRKTLKLFYDL